MLQFTVPQFIEVEDKLIGSITAKQFVIMLGGFLLIGIGYKLFDFSLFVAHGIFELIIIVLFAFYKVNGQPFYLFLINVIQTLKRPKLRIWNKEIGLPLSEDDDNKIAIIPLQTIKKPVIKSRLAELSLMVDTQGIYKGEDNDVEEGEIESVQ
ncbi:PrgI family protein [Patescibacteria group bacterium]|nr:PrgI family protein [Patescibacteria group bacterium]MBU1160608.1 PrgI family protein [Patescibacteria group bacterium]MBU1349731.1 PrgI family protein [Patescibacteria group bacterium]MBU1421047.1 PrgI family protein [Patescibacteria group bacterium]MBU1683863.1 PrgI family protein [Patescibacteria group bacterium]